MTKLATIPEEAEQLPVENPTQQLLTVPVVAHLMSKGKTQADIGKLFNISRSAVCQYIARHKQDLSVLKDFDPIMINTLKHNANRLQQSITDKDIKGSSLSQKYIATAISIDKARLLEDKSTSNVSVLSNVVQGLHENI